MYGQLKGLSPLNLELLFSCTTEVDLEQRNSVVTVTISNIQIICIFISRHGQSNLGYRRPTSSLYYAALCEPRQFCKAPDH